MKSHAWKACVRLQAVPRVRIPPSPPQRKLPPRGAFSFVEEWLVRARWFDQDALRFGAPCAFCTAVPAPQVQGCSSRLKARRSQSRPLPALFLGEWLVRQHAPVGRLSRRRLTLRAAQRDAEPSPLVRQHACTAKKRIGMGYSHATYSIGANLFRHPLTCRANQGRRPADATKRALNARDAARYLSILLFQSSRTPFVHYGHSPALLPRYVRSNRQKVITFSHSNQAQTTEKSRGGD